MQDLLQGYRETRRALGKVLGKTKDKEDRSQISSMIRDCEYVIEWLSTGRRPGNIRGIERLAAYQREIPVDPEQLPVHPEPTARRMDLNDYNRIIQVMSILSRREKQCYEMHHVGLYSEYEIAQELGIQRTSVQKYLERAEQKIQEFIKNPVQQEILLEFVV